VEEGVRPRPPPADRPVPAFSTAPKGQGPRLPVDVGPPRAGPRALPATTTEQVAHRGRRKLIEGIEGIAPPGPAFSTVLKGLDPRPPVDVGPPRAGPRALPAMARAQAAHRARRAGMDRPGHRARLARMSLGRRFPGDGESVPARRRHGGRKRIPDPLRSLFAR